MEESWLILAGAGLFAGIIAAILGIGGGFIIVSLLIALNYSFPQAIATSSVVIVMSASAGSFYNWRMGYLNLHRVVYLAIPAIVFAPLGAYLTEAIPEYVLMTMFASFMLVNIALIQLKKKIAAKQQSTPRQFNPVLARIVTGGMAGLLAGLFGIGGGVIMVPLQMLLLNEDIKTSVRTSLGVIVGATLSSCVFHLAKGNVLFIPSLILGITGMFGSQLGTRLLPKLSNSLVSRAFTLFLGSMALFNFWKAWNTYQNIT